MADASVRVSHVAIAVSDLQVSLRFYCEGLGFEPGPCFQSGDEVAAVSELEPPVRMTSQYLTKDGFRLELTDWEVPGVQGEASQTRNQRGLTHLSFEVDDIVDIETRLLALGGQRLPDARVELDREPAAISLVFLTDPDGTRIELLQRHTPTA
jgi:catechol 2,3-dioxygenase-like lactoylglutathione lyase family enzyme